MGECGGSRDHGCLRSSTVRLLLPSQSPLALSKSTKFLLFVGGEVTVPREDGVVFSSRLDRRLSVEVALLLASPDSWYSTDPFFVVVQGIFLEEEVKVRMTGWLKLCCLRWAEDGKQWCWSDQLKARASG